MFSCEKLMYYVPITSDKCYTYLDSHLQFHTTVNFLNLFFLFTVTSMDHDTQEPQVLSQNFFQVTKQSLTKPVNVNFSQFLHLSSKDDCNVDPVVDISP